MSAAARLHLNDREATIWKRFLFSLLLLVLPTDSVVLADQVEPRLDWLVLIPYCVDMDGYVNEGCGGGCGRKCPDIYQSP